MRSHTNERPFVCSYPGCEKAFARQHDRKRHEALHLDDNKPFKCLGCSKKFARIDGLTRHHKSEIGQSCAQKHSQLESNINFSQHINNNNNSISGVLM